MSCSILQASQNLKLLPIRGRNGAHRCCRILPPNTKIPASAPASRTQGRGDGEQARLGPVGAARGVVRRALTRRVEGDLEDARRRIAALERQLREARAMQVRLAQLTDVVNELLLPAAERREDVLAAAERYRRETL